MEVQEPRGKEERQAEMLAQSHILSSQEDGKNRWIGMIIDPVVVLVVYKFY